MRGIDIERMSKREGFRGVKRRVRGRVVLFDWSLCEASHKFFDPANTLNLGSWRAKGRTVPEGKIETDMWLSKQVQQQQDQTHA